MFKTKVHYELSSWFIGKGLKLVLHVTRPDRSNCKYISITIKKYLWEKVKIV